MKMILQDKRALVTGASVGIGRAVAKALAQRGVAADLAARAVTELGQIDILINNAGRAGSWPCFSASWTAMRVTPAKGERDG